jgi:alkanesulfonate monooxygenase SsuD/methylene tetrahydromethanopterin reductase-like flavin-dependent oxidoreductase (luciferase family)
MCLSRTAHRVRVAERGKLEFMFLAASAAVRNRGSPAIPRERGHEHGRIEPLSVLAALATSTNDIGLAKTVLSAAVER